ncbi:MAG: hypothetical protein K0R57_2843 [Paenibacillaceae bacterium]|jgi:hypothetical protein|nr:hypothetical protein [Paenibacillaceae bacterium]
MYNSKWEGNIIEVRTQHHSEGPCISNIKEVEMEWWWKLYGYFGLAFMYSAFITYIFLVIIAIIYYSYAFASYAL